jgi:hypothetical protein
MQLDYDILPPKVFVTCMEKIFDDKSLKEYKDSDMIIPIMASGHVKRVQNWENIERILNDIQTRLKDRISYWTLRDAVNYWLKR